MGSILPRVGPVTCSLGLHLNDTNRPILARSSAASIVADRTATARLLSFIALGGVLLSLGAVWAHVGFLGTMIVGLEADASGQLTTIVGTGYREIARPMLLAGYAVQGIGAAVLMRLIVDTLRASASLRRSKVNPAKAATNEVTVARPSAPSAQSGEVK